MVKPVILILGAIPAIIAMLIAVPMIMEADIPFSAANSSDVIEFEYATHDLTKVTFGLTERLGSQKTEILVIKNNGQMTYSVTKDGKPQPDVNSKLEEDHLNRLRALVKETGFMTIPPESFPIMDDINSYKKSSVKITLNGHANQIHWPEQSATEKFIPPIITMVEAQLDDVVRQITAD